MIKRFTGEYNWLSNFAPAEVWLDGESYPTVEHAYVAAKTLSPVWRFEVKGAANPGLAKQFGRNLDLRPNWDNIRYGIMENLLRQKFSISEYREKLYQTGDVELVEGNVWHDNYWGSCICASCGDKGENNLGKLLMKIREETKQLSLNFG